MVVKTFRTAFPATTVWHAHGVADFILVGSAEPRPLDLARVQAAWDGLAGAARGLRAARLPRAVGVPRRLPAGRAGRGPAHARRRPQHRRPAAARVLGAQEPAPRHRRHELPHGARRSARRELPLLAERGAALVDTPGARHDLGMAYLRKDLPAEAAAQFERGARPATPPTCPRCSTSAACSSAWTCRCGRSRRCRPPRATTRAAPRPRRCWRASGRPQQLPARALEAAADAVRLAPDEPALPRAARRAARAAGRPGEAVEQYLTARAQRPRDVALLESLAGAYARLGRGADAVTTLEAAAPRSPTTAALLHRLGRAYLAVNQPTPAVPVLDPRRRPRAQLAQAHADLGLAHLGTGDPFAALRRARARAGARSRRTPAPPSCSARSTPNSTEETTSDEPSPAAILFSAAMDVTPDRESAVPRGLRHRARAAHPDRARRHRGHALRDAAAHDDAGRRAQDDGSAGRPALPRPLRAGQPRGPAVPSVGQGRRAGPLARPGPPPHQQPPPPADGAAWLRSAARLRAPSGEIRLSSYD